MRGESEVGAVNEALTWAWFGAAFLGALSMLGAHCTIEVKLKRDREDRGQVYEEAYGFMRAAACFFVAAAIALYFRRR